MAEYTQIKADLWQDPEFESLGPHAKLLWLNLLTTPARNTAGLYHMSVRRMAFETGLTEETVTDALGQLAGRGWIVYHQPTGVVWIRNFIRRQPWSDTIRTKVLKDVAGIGEDHPLSKELRNYYADLLDTPSQSADVEIAPIDTPSMPHAYPIDTPPMGSARGNGTERDGTEQKEELRARSKAPEDMDGAARWVADWVDAHKDAGRSPGPSERARFGAAVKRIKGPIDAAVMADAISRMVQERKGPHLADRIYDDCARAAEDELLRMQTEVRRVR